ncbi:hypothetical protein BH10PSE6_BH10PSE6_23020 [soil metagenome]
MTTPSPYDGDTSPSLCEGEERATLANTVPSRQCWPAPCRSDGAKPMIMWNASASCWHPHVKGFRPMVNSLYNGSRFEEIWLDKQM